MNKKIILGLAGTALFVISFLLGKTTIARAGQEGVPGVTVQEIDSSHTLITFGRVACVSTSSGVSCVNTNP